MTAIVSQSQAEQYHREGYCILEKALPEEYFNLLREECQTAIDRLNTEMNRQGRDYIGSSRRGLQYFPGNCYKEQPHLWKFLISEFMAEVCRPLLGPSAYLFWEQLAVKFGEAQAEAHQKATFAEKQGPSSQGLFSWHQDSGYVPYDHLPYLTCWVALDNVSEASGAVRILPFSAIGIRTRVQHVPEPSNGDLVGYFGDKLGIAAVVPAGSIVCFSSVSFHSSPRNITDGPRRAYLCQYSPEPIMNAEKNQLSNIAEPLLADGKYVAGSRLAALVAGQ